MEHFDLSKHVLSILLEDYTTLEMVSAGLHCSLRMSKQIFPLLLIFGWKTLVLKATYRTERELRTETKTKKENKNLFLLYTFGGLKG